MTMFCVSGPILVKAAVCGCLLAYVGYTLYSVLSGLLWFKRLSVYL